MLRRDREGSATREGDRGPGERNTGIGIAFTAAALGLRRIFTGHKALRRAALRALGGIVVYRRRAGMRGRDRARGRDPRAPRRPRVDAAPVRQPRQPGGPLPVGPESGRTRGAGGHLRRRRGDGGVTGAGRYLRERKPTSSAVRPPRVVLSGGGPGPHRSGDRGRLRAERARHLHLRQSSRHNDDAIATRRLAREEGSWQGSPPGRSPQAALRVAERPGAAAS